MGGNIGRFEFENPPVLLGGFRETTEIEQQLAIVMQGIDIAGIILKLSNTIHEEIHSPTFSKYSDCHQHSHKEWNDLYCDFEAIFSSFDK